MSSALVTDAAVDPTAPAPIPPAPDPNAGRPTPLLRQEPKQEMPIGRYVMAGAALVATIVIVLIVKKPSVLHQPKATNPAITAVAAAPAAPAKPVAPAPAPAAAPVAQPDPMVELATQLRLLTDGVKAMAAAKAAMDTAPKDPTAEAKALATALAGLNAPAAPATAASAAVAPAPVAAAAVTAKPAPKPAESRPTVVVKVDPDKTGFDYDWQVYWPAGCEEETTPPEGTFAACRKGTRMYSFPFANVRRDTTGPQTVVASVTTMAE